MKTLKPDVISDLKALDDDGSDSVLKEIIDLYLDSTPPKLKKMADFLAKNDLASMRKEAHSLRSSSLTIGAEALSHYASEIEYVPELASIEAAVKSAFEEFEKVKIELKKLR